MKNMTSALVCVILGVSTWGLGALGPAELGAELAKLLTALAPVEIYRQGVLLMVLSGTAEPDAEGALSALDELEAQLGELVQLLADDPTWEGTYAELAGARKGVEQARAVLSAALPQGLAALPEEERDAVVEALGQVRKSLEQVVLVATEEAGDEELGWPFQVAFLAQTVLLSPSPLYLRIGEDWQGFLSQGLPQDVPPGSVEALNTLFALSNRTLTEEEEDEARQAAQLLLGLLLSLEGGEGGG
jgi:hypothetical protein